VVVRRQAKRCLPGRDHRELDLDPVVLEAEQSSAPAPSFAAAATPPWEVPTTSRGGLGSAVALIDWSAQPASGRPSLDGALGLHHAVPATCCIAGQRRDRHRVF
jgi:hypothetical protein